MTAPVLAAQIAAQIATVTTTLPPRVRLIAVSKKQPVEAIRAAYQAGVRDFGESMVQEAIAKQAELTDLKGITWHLIGHLQTNKARKALESFNWIHSIDSLKIAERLDRIAADIARTPQCCLQVKMVPDDAKFGFSVEALWEALPQLEQLQHLNIVGLMTIPPQGTSVTAAQAIFCQAQTLLDQINQQDFDRLHLSELSMGMSGDYPVAIAAGSTMIRLGTTLFGDRPA
ncbi:MAG: YggS family pyridoxal phosphate-dependent enzyme [Leptolyngbyaceae cyanobacterium]